MPGSLSAGIPEKNDSKAPSPPAEAPIATMGKDAPLSLEGSSEPTFVLDFSLFDSWEMICFWRVMESHSRELFTQFYKSGKKEAPMKQKTPAQCLLNGKRFGANGLL
nr:hypothetical protein [Desulfatibacillum aliphaticivorans]